MTQVQFHGHRIYKETVQEGSCRVLFVGDRISRTGQGTSWSAIRSQQRSQPILVGELEQAWPLSPQILSNCGDRVCIWTCALTKHWEELRHGVRSFRQRQILKMVSTEKCRWPTLGNASQRTCMKGPWTWATLWELTVGLRGGLGREGNGGNLGHL